MPRGGQTDGLSRFIDSTGAFYGPSCLPQNVGAAAGRPARRSGRCACRIYFSSEYNPAEKPGVTKQVVYFLAQYTDGIPCVVRPNEVSSLKSLRFEDAYNIIEYDNKKEMLKQADDHIKKYYL